MTQILIFSSSIYEKNYYQSREFEQFSPSFNYLESLEESIQIDNTYNQGDNMIAKKDPSRVEILTLAHQNAMYNSSHLSTIDRIVRRKVYFT